MTNNDYIAHTLIQTPQGLEVIAYKGIEPTNPEQLDYRVHETTMYKAQVVKYEDWLSTAKKFPVRPEDIEAIKALLNGPMTLANVCKSDIDELLHDGINIESIAHRVVFQHYFDEDWFATLLPEDKQINSVTLCPTCGSECSIGGTNESTHYYIPKDKPVEETQMSLDDKDRFCYILSRSFDGFEDRPGTCVSAMYELLKEFEIKRKNK